MRRFFSFLLTLFTVPVLYIVLIPGIAVAGLTSVFGRRLRLVCVDFWYRWWNRAMIWATMSRVSVYGRENLPGGAIVLFANHSSYLDISIITGFVVKNASYMARRSLLKLFPVGLWVLAGDGVLVERKGSRKELEAVLKIVKRLKNGRSFVIFPEGTRTRTGELGEIKPGALKIPEKAGVPLVPVRIEGTRQILARGAKWFGTGDVNVYIGEPIFPDEIRNDRQKVLEKLKKSFRGSI